MRTLICGGAVITPYQVLPDTTVVLEDGRVAALVSGALEAAGVAEVIDATGLWVAPGMLDVHTHGALGYEAMDATSEALHAMGRYYAQHGVTGYLATTWSAAPEALLAVLQAVARAPQPENGAQHLGVHVEGPFLSVKYRGAQVAAHLRAPDLAEYARWMETGVVRLITIAPELDGALDLIRQGRAAGVEFAIGHSGATYEQVCAAAACGARQATHTCNGMLGLHHREPGTLGGILSDDRIYAQVIADGVHVHPAVIKLMVRAKTPARTLLITDAICGAGLPDGEYDIAGQHLVVQAGVVRNPAGSLAGSTLTLDAALRNVITFTGLALHEALPMATAVPAEAMGWADRGRIAPGARADVILLDAELRVRRTLIGGRTVYCG